MIGRSRDRAVEGRTLIAEGQGRPPPTPNKPEAETEDGGF